MKSTVTMGFMDAVNSMISGAKCVRQSWMVGFYVCILGNQSFIWNVAKDTSNTTNSSVYVPSINDILANDWVVKN